MKKSVRPWLSFVSAFLMLFTSIGLLNNGMSLFYVPVTTDLGFAQASFSMYHTIATIVCTVSSPLFGRFYSKRVDKMRLSMLISGIILLISFVLYSRANSLWEFYLISVLRGLVMGGLCATAGTMIISNWFIKKYSLMVALAFIGSSLGGICYTQLCKFLLASATWRTAYLVVGIVGFVTVLIAVLISVPSPELVGMKPYGYDENERKIPVNQEGMSFGNAIRTPVFWIIGLGTLLFALAGGGVMQVIPSALQRDQGFDAAFAANITSLYMVFMCVGKPILGALTDKLGLKGGLLYCNTAMLIALVCMFVGSGVSVMAYVFAVCFGLGNLIGTMGLTAITTNVFGRKDYGTIHPVLHMFYTVGVAVSPMIAGRVFDISSRYYGFWIFAIACEALALILFQFAARKKYAYQAQQ